MKPSTPTDLGRELVRFFGEFLPEQRGLSRNTVRSYRDGLLLLLQFTSADARRSIERLEISDLTAERVVKFYNGRGTAEQWIKEGKLALRWTRLSCRAFRDNAVRLQLFALAYNLANFLRSLALPREIEKCR